MTTTAGQADVLTDAFEDGDISPSRPLGIYGVALALGAVLNSAVMLLAALFSFGDGVDLAVFGVGGLVLGLVGGLSLRRPFSASMLRPVPAMAAVVTSLIAMACLSAVVYLLTGSLDRVDDALYESFAGVSTSALSIFADPATLTDGVLIWRAGTQWVGGLAAVLLAAGLLPFLGGSRELMGGPQFRARKVTGLGSRPLQVVKRSMAIYGTVTLVVTLGFLVAGMGLRDALAHSLSTVSTGGFSTRAESFGYFDSSAIELVAMIGMIGAGASVAFAWIIWRRAFADTRRAFELQIFIGAIVASTLWIWWLRRDEAESAWIGLREAMFSVVSMITTTGYRIADWGSWHPGASALLLVLLVVGGTAGSVAGGLRWIRIIGMAQFVWRELQRQLHPRSVRTVKVGRSRISEASVDRMHAQMVYVMTLGAVASLVLALFGEGITEAITLTMSAISTAGPGFDDNGGIYTAAELTRPERAVLMPVMLTGRVFLYPAFVAVVAGATSVARVASGIRER